MKIKSQYETEVYLSESGYLVIKQIDSAREEHLVVLALEQVRILAAELQKYASDPEWWTAEVRDEHDPS